MRSRMMGLGGLAALLVLVAACGAKPPPPPPPPPPPVEEPKVEAPPPPKCESLDEKCTSKDDTVAKIAKTGLSFAPPPGWIYAQTDAATIAQHGDGAMLVIAGWDPGDPKDKKAETSRDAQLEALMKQANVGLKKKMNWKKKPDITKEPAGLKVDLWDAGIGNRGDKKGAVIVLSAPIEGTKSLLGFGFVSDDDHSENETILKALDAITKGGK